MAINSDGRVTTEEGQRRFIPPSERSPLPQAGSTIALPRKVWSFAGSLEGEVTIEQSYYDHYGRAQVSLSKSGRLIVTGISWPIEVNNDQSKETPVAAGNADHSALPVYATTEASVETRRAGMARPDQARSAQPDCRQDVQDRPVVRTNDIPGSGEDQGKNHSAGKDAPCQRRVGLSPGGAIQPKKEFHCGVVCIVDTLNLLVRAWHASPPTKIHAVKSLLWTVANIIERLSPEFLIFAADGGHSARTKLYADYKAHRPPKPEGLIAQIELAEKALDAIGWPLVRVAGWEADDVAASIATQIAPTAAGVVIVSSDKDLCQLVGFPGVKVYHPWDKGVWINAKSVEEKFGVKPNQIGDYLALCGDGTDGVPGVKGVGEKTAAELLTRFRDLDTILTEAHAGRVPGMAGKNLKEHADTARLSRDLVKLQCEIPSVTDHWSQWPAVEPRANWIQAIRDLGLGIVVDRLKAVMPVTGKTRPGSSALTMEWDRIETFYVEANLAPVSSDCGNRPKLSARDAVPERQGTEGRNSDDVRTSGAVRSGINASDLAAGDAVPRPVDVHDGASPGISHFRKASAHLF